MSNTKSGLGGMPGGRFSLGIAWEIEMGHTRDTQARILVAAASDLIADINERL